KGNDICRFWPTCDPNLKDCNGGDSIYGMDEHDVLKQWYCYCDNERQHVKALRKHLKEKHVTWGLFEKKLDKNTTLQACDFHFDAFTKSAQKVEFLIKSVTSDMVETTLEIYPDGIRIEERWRHHEL
ncbi:hypothetical protein Tco_1235650, partial [Tanacetum coccineum]